MLTLVALIIVFALLALSAALLYFWKRRPPPRCANCGSPSQFGYSEHAESEANQIVRLCFNCLAAKLRDDYDAYAGHALVIEPAADLPCYVFQPKSKWGDTKLGEDLTKILSNRDDACRCCALQARFLWVTSKGLLASNFSEVLSDGISLTLLRWGNDSPLPLCSKCCVESIKKTIESRRLTFLEVCAPRSEDGLVIPMAY